MSRRAAALTKVVADIVIALALDPSKRVEVWSARPEARDEMMEVAGRCGIILDTTEAWFDSGVYRFTIESFKYIREEKTQQ